MHDTERIKELALKKEHDYKSLMAELTAFKEKGWRKIECILFIKYNQDVDLNRAAEILFENSDWKPEGKQFRQHQIDMHEEALGYSTYNIFKTFKNLLSSWFNSKELR